MLVPKSVPAVSPTRRHRNSVAVPALPGGALALVAAVTLLTAFAAGDGVLPGDVALTRWVQATALPGAATVAQAANAIGSSPATFATAGALGLGLAVVGRHAGAALVLASLLVRAANPLLKSLADSPRPTSDLVRVSEQAGGLGFPSAHVMGVVLLYGSVVVLAEGIPHPWLRRAVQAPALSVILATGFGRIYTGAHWPSDVLGGVLWGATLLLLLRRGLRLAPR